jgi:hypothetical protein
VLRTGAVAAVPVVAIRLSEQLFASVEHIIADLPALILACKQQQVALLRKI